MNTDKNNTQLPQSSVSVSAFLNGKAKQDFLDYYWKNYIGKTRFLNQKSETEEFFNSLYPTFQNTLIIDFFDSTVFIVGVNPNVYNEFTSFVNEKGTYKQWRSEGYFETRKLALEKAIEKANELYNAHFLADTQAEH